MKTLFDYQDYLKVKGWIDMPPLYPYVPDGVEERITSNEVFYLWDHLTFRYANIHMTRIYSSYVYDKDLKLLGQWQGSYNYYDEDTDGSWDRDYYPEAYWSLCRRRIQN